VLWRTQNSRGYIAGSVITLSDAVRMMLSLGVGVEEIARMAALNPATLLGLDHEYGTIEKAGGPTGWLWIKTGTSC
jgi:N-acetylglucosamine-6-phosphate deacetylase